MKLLALILVALLAWTASTLAAPFLVCDPVPVPILPTDPGQPTSYILVIDGGAPITVSAQINADLKAQLHYDVGGVSTGAHSLTVRAVNQWGQSSASPFTFTKSTPGAPISISIVAQ
jgi:hypothetical protein